jgi:phosphatidylglycerol:prolipoprotein diacylglycerol transferase
MIPYIHIPDLHIGPVPLHPFGILVATGVLVGTSLATWRARKLGYDLAALNSFITWMLVTGFVLSHVLDYLFYHWKEVVERPWSLLMVWEGLSSFGGFIGAVVGVLLWKYLDVEKSPFRWRKEPYPILPFADLVFSVFPVAWMFGRMGCASVHDHPGARATAGALLAVAYPKWPGEGTVTHVGFIEFIVGHDPRYDLGLLELLFTIMLASALALTWRRKLTIGTYAAVVSLSYAPVRFAMDFLRVPESAGGDTRYGGLTPAQWCCFALFLYGAAMVWYVRQNRIRGVDLAALVRVPPAPVEEKAAGAGA